jgi:sugar phosphate isomerase/epimerase
MTNVLVAASLECLPDLSFESAIEFLSDLDFTAIEVDLHEEGGHIKPSDLLADPEQHVHRLRNSHRLDLVGFSVQLGVSGEEHYEQFRSICRLAKATKVVTLTVPSAELGTPFNEEVEHLQRLVDLAETEGVRIAVKSELGCLSEDPDTLMVLCDNVHGLGIALDPSVYICGPAKGKELDRIMKYVFNVHLRDSRPDAFHVSIGQGVVDYGRLVNQLEREGYDRTLTMQVPPIKGLDHRVELRKLRRLLESLI